MAVKKSDWRPNIFVKGSEQTPHQAAQHTRQVKFGNPQKKLCNTLINLQQLGSSLVCRAIGGRSWGVMPFKVHGLTQEFRALHTYSVITNSLHIHKLGVVRWGGGGQGHGQQDWCLRSSQGSVCCSRSLQPQICMHIDSLTTGLPCCRNDWIKKQQSHLNN